MKIKILDNNYFKLEIWLYKNIILTPRTLLIPLQNIKISLNCLS